MSAAVIALIAFCILAEVGRELCFKIAADRGGGTGRYASSVVKSPIAWTGVVLWLVEIVAWVVVLQQAPLSLAFPMMSLVYAGVPAAAALFLKERMGRSQVAGAGLIAVGILCVSVSEMRP